MSKFIELSDYDASIHREILDALTREVTLSWRYVRTARRRDALLPFQTFDCDKIFTATGDKRNQLVLMMAIE